MTAGALPDYQVSLSTLRLDTFVQRCTHCGGWRIAPDLERTPHTCPERTGQ